MSDIFPTGKPHISFSEIKTWAECPNKHWLMYVEKIETYTDNPYVDFGTIVHEEIEVYLNSKTLDIEKVCKKIEKKWNEKGYDSDEYIQKISDERATNGWKYQHETLDDWKKSARNILQEFPEFMNASFPGWEPMCAEFQLYENIEDQDIKFKGFIDCIIAVPKGNKKIVWILDWKTTGKGGWYFKKKQEFLSLAQIGMYKSFWSRKLGIDLKDIRAGYVFLKRGQPAGKTCELFTVSVGPKFVQRTDDLIKRMIHSVKKGISLKNYDGCKFCPFKNTEHCNGNGW